MPRQGLKKLLCCFFAKFKQYWKMKKIWKPRALQNKKKLNKEVHLAINCGKAEC